MKTPRHILAQAIAEKTLHISDKKALAREIAAYLLVEKRTNELESILRDCLQYRSDHGVLEATIVTAHDVSDQVVSEVKHLLKTTHRHAKTVHVAKRHDDNVIGGLRIDMANEQLDLSIRTKLATLKRVLGGHA